MRGGIQISQPFLMSIIDSEIKIRQALSYEYGQILKLLTEAYGPVTALRIHTNVIPGIKEDFKQMLKKAFPGIEISEEYIFDDISGSIRLFGRRDTDGTLFLTGFALGGRSLRFENIL